MQLEEEARALGKRQRKQFSHVGLVAAAFMIVTFLAQIAVISFAGFINYLLGGIIDLFSGPGILLLSAIPMYFRGPDPADTQMRPRTESALGNR